MITGLENNSICENSPRNLTKVRRLHTRLMLKSSVWMLPTASLASLSQWQMVSFCHCITTTEWQMANFKGCISFCNSVASTGKAEHGEIYSVAACLIWLFADLWRNSPKGLSIKSKWMEISLHIAKGLYKVIIIDRWRHDEDRICKNKRWRWVDSVFYITDLINKKYFCNNSESTKARSRTSQNEMQNHFKII